MQVPTAVMIGRVCAVACCLLALLAPTAGAASAVRLAAQIPGTVSAGSAVMITGDALRAPRGSWAVLERKTTVGWRAIVRDRLHRGAFKLTWRPQAGRYLTLRVAIRRDGRDLASSPVRQVLVGAAPVYCAAPVRPANVPAGDGWIAGGLYIAGGPAPGVYECVNRPYTITLTDQTGASIAIQEVAAGQSYTFVLPPGTYNLSSSSNGGCSGSATVSAGEQTKADTVCSVP